MADEGYMTNDTIIIDGIEYSAGESTFSKTQTSPTYSTNPTYPTTAYPEQDSFSGTENITVTPTIICDSPSQSSCHDVSGTQVTTTGGPVLGTFYGYSSLWQEVTYNGEIKYIPYSFVIDEDEGDYGGGVVYQDDVDNTFVNGLPYSEDSGVGHGIFKDDTGANWDSYKDSQNNSEVKYDYPHRLIVSVRGCKNLSSSASCTAFPAGTYVKLKAYFDATLATYRSLLAKNYGLESYLVRCGSSAFRAGVCDRKSVDELGDEEDDDDDDDGVTSAIVMDILKQFMNNEIPSKEDNANRNNNMQSPPTYKKAIDLGWTQMSDSKSVFHRIGLENLNNKKMISPDKLSEAVYDSDENLVTNPTNYGTFNMQSPDDYAGHFTYDIVPYGRWGNGEGDITNKASRITCSGTEYCAHTIIDEIQIITYEVKEETKEKINEVKTEIVETYNETKTFVVETVDKVKAEITEAYSDTKDAVNKAAKKTKEITSSIGAKISGWFSF